MRWVTRQSAITFELAGITGSPAYGQIGLWMANLFPMHLGKKEGFKGSKTEMSVKMVRFCKVCLSLGCVFCTTLYGRIWDLNTKMKMSSWSQRKTPKTDMWPLFQIPSFWLNQIVSSITPGLIFFKIQNKWYFLERSLYISVVSQWGHQNFLRPNKTKRWIWFEGLSNLLI